MGFRPAPIADEREGLLTFLAQQRAAIRAAAHGLTEEQLRATPSASALSIGGLLKHVAQVERGWMAGTVAGQDLAAEREEAYLNGFTPFEEETLEVLLARYDAVAAETESIVASIPDLARPVPVPDEPWFPKDVEAWSVRWVLFHLIQETARHAGHADLVRESLDGATAWDLLAASEGLAMAWA